MSGDVVSLNLIFVLLPLCIRNWSPRQDALASNQFFSFKLVRNELFAVLNSHHINTTFSKEFSLLSDTEAVLTCFTVALVKPNKNHACNIPILIAIKDQLLWIRDAVQFSKNQVKLICINFIWLVKLIFVIFCTLVKR